MSTDPVAAFEHAFRLHRAGKLLQALAAYEALLQRWPAHADALHYSGIALHQSGYPERASARIEQSLKLAPGAGDAWCNLGLAYQAEGRLDEAIAALQEAVRVDPRQAQYWNNLAGMLLASGRASEGEAAARQSLAVDADNAAGQFNLALCLEAQGKLDEALARCAAMLLGHPASIEAAGLKAQIEATLGRLDAASATLASALAQSGVQPAAAPLHLQRADVEQRRGQFVDAAQSLEQVLRIDPDAAGALSELLFLRKELADWHDLVALRARFRAGIAAGKRQLSPFCLLSEPSTRAEQRACAEHWSAAHPPLPRPQRTPPSGILRIGYLSSDFHQHATAVLAAGLFEAHDRQRCKVLGYSTGPDDGSGMRARLVAAFDTFVDAWGWPARDLAARIAADGVDILVDLKGHTFDARTDVVALRPAPIQVNYLGYPGTMGAPFIDYLIGDPIVTPFEHGADYAETLVQLPGCYQINDRKRTSLQPPPRRDLGLPDDAFVFCSFNQTYKLNPENCDAWARILTAVPGSVLWLLGGRGPAIDRLVDANLQREFVARGIDASRVIVASRRPHAEYVGLYRHADLFLDTWPYNAHTTASDALWAGCPVLTWLGDTFAGRVAASLVTAVGLPQLVAADVARYVAQAIELATQPQALAAARAQLAAHGRQSPLFDTVATTRALEAAYMTMADQSRRGVREPIRVGAGPA